MTTPKTPLPDMDESELDNISGAMRTGGRTGSKNVLDCRGPTCLDSNGKVDPVATRAHKGKPVEISGERNLPKGDGGGLGTPRVPRAR